MNILAIDSGLSGAVAMFVDGKLTHVDKMPTKQICIQEKLTQLDLKDGKKQIIKSGPNKGNPKMKVRRPAKYKTELDCKILTGLMFAADMIIIEKQGCQVMNSTKACSTTMFNYGKLIAIAEVSETKYITALPSTWKTAMHITMSKDEKKALGNNSADITRTLKAKAVSLAKRLSGRNFVSERGRMLDGEAEAYLIGYWFINTKDKKDDKNI